MDHPVQVLLSCDQKWPTYRPSKWCSFCRCIRYTPNFCPFFGIPEILWTTLSKFCWVLIKNGRHIGLQNGAHFAVAYSIHQFFAYFWNPWNLMDHPVQVLLNSDQKWLEYRPSKWCSFSRCIRYTPIFCPFLTKNGWDIVLQSSAFFLAYMACTKNGK